MVATHSEASFNWRRLCDVLEAMEVGASPVDSPGILTDHPDAEEEHDPVTDDENEEVLVPTNHEVEGRREEEGRETLREHQAHVVELREGRGRQRPGAAALELEGKGKKR